MHGRPLQFGTTDSDSIRRQAAIAAALLRRQPLITDEQEYDCDIFAAAGTISGDLAYLESRAKDVGPSRYGDFGRHIDVSIKVHLIQAGEHRSADIKSYNPYFGCDVHVFDWFRSRAILIYTEKHGAYACAFGDVWPPMFKELGWQWVQRGDEVLYRHYQRPTISRLALPSLADLEPIAIEEAAKQGLLPADSPLLKD
jgi:hypothetical protein